MSLNDVIAVYQTHQTLLTTIAILAGLGLLLVVASRIRRMSEHRLTLLVANILTVIAAALATMVSASGMWKFFTDILGPSPLRIVFFAYIETALFASALLARARLLRDPQKGSTGIDGAAVWVLAALTASLSALDADSFPEVCLRLVAPLVAAWMWGRALAAERSARLGRSTTGIHWTVTLERILVWLRLAEAQDRDVTEVDRARRRARLGRARLNLYLLQNKKTPAWRVRRAHHRVIRRAMQAAEHIGLADFPEATNEREAIQMYMATLYGFVEATSPDAVSHLNAWQPGPVATESDGAALAPAHDGTTQEISEEPLETADSTRRAQRSLHGLNGDSREANTSAPGTSATLPDDGPAHQHGHTASTWQPMPMPQHSHGNPPADDEDDSADARTSDEDADTSAVAAMRRFWDSETARGRIPTGAELSRAAGVPPNTGLGRRKRREWEIDLPDHLKASATTGR
ncbi:hypothetical protein F6X54_10095 [Micromonospora aurantiaca]|uniref:DUF2637 domain-containing protein n=1 Tax=Micromonospora aurantiaca (nom. illeg.) TaxID=47850 RepID=A0ABQ6UIU0_9ACTN|nr:hypothetical protein [Micromonospora aurantiaca]KAB1116826.1 hypothetical protein F6X54_10095 [Micromonospora aurantiaca]